MHRGSHHLNLWVQGKFDSGVPGGLTLPIGFFFLTNTFVLMKKRQRKQLRDSLRYLRRNLLVDDQQAASNAVYELIVRQDFFMSATNLAFYISFDGELDPKQILQEAINQGKSCYLPIIPKSSENEMNFGLYDQETLLKESKWGIQEPLPHGSLISPFDLEVVFVPLVGFDDKCSRLGMGKGLYDKTFNFKDQNSSIQPLLVGLAHECQHVQEIPTEKWDVRLDLIVTGERIYRSNRP